MKKNLPDNWKELIMEFGNSGYSLAEILHEFGMTRKQHMQMLTDNPEYESIFEHVLIAFEAWWRREGRLNLKEKGFNYTAWYKHMVNEFKWRDNPADDKKDPDEVDTKMNLNETAAKYVTKKLSVVN